MGAAAAPRWCSRPFPLQRDRRTATAHVLEDAGVARALRMEGTPRLLIAIGGWVAAELAASRALAGAGAIQVKVRQRAGDHDAIAGAAWTAEEYMARRAILLVSAVVEQVRRLGAGGDTDW